MHFLFYFCAFSSKALICCIMFTVKDSQVIYCEREAIDVNVLEAESTILQQQSSRMNGSSIVLFLLYLHYREDITTSAICNLWRIIPVQYVEQVYISFLLLLWYPSLHFFLYFVATWKHSMSRTQLSVTTNFPQVLIYFPSLNVSITLQKSSSLNFNSSNEYRSI